MSKFVEFVVRDLRDIDGLEQEMTSWGGENTPFDPPRYRYDDLAFNLVPLALHVMALLPPSLCGVKKCLELDETIVREWSTGRLQLRHQESLQRFLCQALPSFNEWLAVYDSSSGARHTVVSCARGELFDRMQEVITVSAPERGLVLCIPKPRPDGVDANDKIDPTVESREQHIRALTETEHTELELATDEALGRAEPEEAG